MASILKRLGNIARAYLPSSEGPTSAPHVSQEWEPTSHQPPSSRQASMPADVRRAYRVLEVEPGADLKTVKKAYRKMQHLYHQDRFADNPEKERKAQKVSTEINLAYERLVSYLTANGS